MKSSLTSFATVAKSSPPSTRSFAACGLVERGLTLLVGRLGAGLRVLGERLDQDEVGVHPLGERQPLRDFGVDLVVA